MSTIVNQAVSAIVAALQTAPVVCTQIMRTNLREIPLTITQAVNVRPIQSEATNASDIGLYPTNWSTSIAVECYARANASTAADQAIDALLEAVYARIMTDPTLGGTVVALSPAHLAYDFDVDGQKTACATIVFTTLQRANAGLLT